MPARVDADKRRHHIIEAALRLVVVHGLTALTFQKVADEARLNIGSVRHYFADHETLVVGAVTEAGARMGRRLARHTPPPDAPRDVAHRRLEAVVEELVPLDERRRREAAVLMEVVTAARTTPAFAPVVDQMAADLRAVLTDALHGIGVADPDLEATRL